MGATSATEQEQQKQNSAVPPVTRPMVTSVWWERQMLDPTSQYFPSESSFQNVPPTLVNNHYNCRKYDFLFLKTK